jgi:hypothetical protein
MLTLGSGKSGDRSDLKTEMDFSGPNCGLRLYRKSAPVVKLLTNLKMTLWMAECIKVERLP